MSEQDREPMSVPATLTEEQNERVRARLERFARGTSVRIAARSLGYSRRYMRAVVAGEIRASVHFAAQVARVTRIDLAVLLGLVCGGGP
ncbi:hypothetical protein [Polyangium spumosum]|uniref:Helix-turn-helix domain-containing protein n=1 Tax=Polyangium spumosum TaxID=889282 RepID=A0A6N7PNK1_9BACT|nr:hypothetical protein [Polyangium spumosum]MRG90491.1 hypothetical protein [Polyangium spumosum]